MALAIATNNAALRAAAAASGVNRDMETSMARLSSGKRINSASDDAAGVAISSRLTANIRGTDQAIRNALDGQALIDTAEGAHKEIENILQRMREVSVQAANDTNNQQDRDNLQAEMDAMSTEIDRIAATTTWAGAKMLDTDGSTFNFHIGAGVSNQDHIDVNIGAMTSSALGLGGSTSSGGNLIEITGATFASGRFTALVENNEVTDTGVTVTFDATDNALTVTGTATRAAHLEIDLSSASGNVLLTSVTLNIGDTQETIAAAIKTAIDNVSSALVPVTATADTVAGTVTIDGADFEDIASGAVDGFTIDLTSNIITVTGTANTNGTLTLDAALTGTYDYGADLLVPYNNGDDAAAITTAIKTAIDDAVGSMTGGTTTLISLSSSSSSSSSSSRTVNNAISGQGTNSIMAIPAQSGASGIDLVIGSVTVTGIDISTGDATAAAAAITSAINDGNGSPGSDDGTAAHGVTATDALDGAGNINLSFAGSATAGDVAAYVSGSGSSSSGTANTNGTLILDNGPSDPSFTQDHNGFFITIKHPTFENPSSGGDDWDITSAGMLTSYSIPGIVILENQAEIDGSLIQSFGAFSGTPSTDGIGGVKLYAHLGNGDRVDITSGSGGKSVAWFELADGRIVLGIEGTTAIANVAQIADDGQTIVEFEFSRAQNYSGQRLVDPYLQTSGGSLSGAFPPQPDGIVSGTSGDDLIETTYTDDAGGDRVDGPENDSNNAMTAITAIDTAIETVNTQRSKLGAVSNRLTHTLNNLTNISANLSAARGGIEDADFAFETTQLAKNQILQQASTAMLAQANASKQNVLSLLQG